MNKIHDTFSTILGGTGIILSVQEINETLNLILLIISIANILIVAVAKTLELYQKKKLTPQKMSEILNDVSKEIENIKGEIDDDK